MADQAPHISSKQTGKKSRVLLLYYSFSGQTSGLLNNIASGLREEGVDIAFVRIRPVKPPRFPIGSISQTLKMIITTSFRCRITIKEPDPEVWEDYDLIILAGPTWSYNPSGPILDLIDRFGRRLFKNRTVLPVISCRGYWRMHWLGLKKILEKCGAEVPNRLVFSHPSPEPWRTLGVFMKIAGMAPERSKVIGRYYNRYGHSREQLAEAEKLGAAIGVCLREKKSLGELDLATPTALP